MIGRLGLILLFAIGGCATVNGSNEMTVSQVLARWEELDDKVISVRGWMGDCTNFRCELHSQADQIGHFDRRNQITLGRQSSEFDALLNSYRGREIVVRGKFDDECLRGICTDRASVLEPIRVLRVIRRERS